MEINKVKLGKAGLETSSLSLGTAGIGNLFHEVTEEDAHDTMQASFDAGVRYFDTAPHYGLGLAERRLGRFIGGLERSEITISSKVGRLIRPNPNYNGGVDDQGFVVPNTVYRILDYSYDGVMRSIEESLERLRIEQLDIVFVHDPDDHEKEAMEGAFPALEELRQAKKIRSYGAGMNQSAMLARFAANTELDVVMCAGRFSLLEQPAMEDLIPIATKKGISIVAAGVFNSGILATDTPNPGQNYNYAPAPQELVQKAQRLAEFCLAAGFSLPQVAAQFPFLQPAIKVVCLGARNGNQAKRNASLFENEVPREVFESMAELGLIEEAVLG